MSSEPSHVRWLDHVPMMFEGTLIVAFEGWNDAGDAASVAAHHLIDQWHCKTIAEIDPEPFFDFTTSRPAVALDNEHNRHILWPANVLTVADDDYVGVDVAVMIGTEPQLRWRTFVEQILQVAEELEVDRIVTLGALLAEVPHSRDVPVYGASDDLTMQVELDLNPSTYEGPTGIVGVLSAAALEADFSTASFWSAVPSYMPGTRSPKAALALVKRVATLLQTSIDPGDLPSEAKKYEQEITELVASDEDSAEYLARLEQAWDAEHAGQGNGDTALRDNPEQLVAEVEQFLREGS